MRYEKPLTNAFDGTDLTYAESSNTNSNTIDVRDYRHTEVQITSKDSYAGTLQAFASYSDTAPDLSAAASESNPYFPVEMKYRNDDTSVPGTTGIVYDGTMDGVRGYSTNTDGIKWVGFKTSSRTAGSIVVQVSAVTNG